MVAIASDGSTLGDFGGFGADAAATTPLALDVTAVRPAVTAIRPAVKRAAPVTRVLAADATDAAMDVTQPRPSPMRRVRLTVTGRQERKAALRIERRLASQHAPRWYERLALWALRVPLAFQRGWWDTYAVTAVMMADRPALRRVVARERTQALQAARRVWRTVGRGWRADDDLWRLQVSELLDAADVRVEVTHDRWGGAHYDARPAMAAHEGAMTHPTLDAVLDGHLARERDQNTWPATRSGSRTRPIAQPEAPAVAAFFTSWYQPLRSLGVTPPPLPRIHRAHDETDTYDPWA